MNEMPSNPETQSAVAVVAQHQPSRQAHVLYPSLLEIIRSLLSILVAALFALTFLLQPFRIPSESMEHTLLVGDFLLVNKMVYGGTGSWSHLLPYRQIQRGDVVVFHFPLDPSEHVVKRVIGLPGDHIRLVNGIVYRNGQAISEPYVAYEPSQPDAFRDQFPLHDYTDSSIDSHWWLGMHSNIQNGELVVPPNSYFVLGDNRNHSRDSRYWGFVPRANIVGRPFVIYFSLRQPSSTDISEFPGTPSAHAAGDKPGDKLRHENEAIDKVIDFARWDRILRVVR
jgi:signal peptidase I